MRPRVVLGAVVVIAFMIFVAIPCLLIVPFERSGRLLLAITRRWARLILFFGEIEVTVQGASNIPAGPVVLAANHSSALDIPLIFACLPVEFRIIHKTSLYWGPVVGWYLYFGRHLGIDRKNAFRARQSLRLAAARIRDGVNVVVFPEGTRSSDGRVKEFKRGSFVLAQDAGVPVVPVALVGVKPLVPRGLLRMRPGSVVMTIHPPVSTAGRDPEEVAAEVRAIIAREVDRSAA